MKMFNADDPVPETDEEALAYLPDNPSAKGMYRVLRKQGYSILEAMQKVLEAVAQV